MMLQNKKQDDGDQESLKLIMASSGLLLNLINNVLDVKRVTEDSKSQPRLSSSDTARHLISCRDSLLSSRRGCSDGRVPAEPGHGVRTRPGRYRVLPSTGFQ